MSSMTTSLMGEKQKRKEGRYHQVQMALTALRMLILTLASVFALFPVIWIFAAAINPAQSMANQSFIPELVRPVRTSTAGEVIQLNVEEGQYVQRRDVVAVVQGETSRVDVFAPLNGTITDLRIAEGVRVVSSEQLMTLDGDVNNLISNFDTLLNTPRKPYTLWVRNSIIVSSTTSILAVLITSMAAYAFSRFRFRFRQGLLVTILLVQVFPNLLAMVALYLILQQLGRHIPFLGLDTLGGLILVYLGGQMGINIWLMKGFFDSVPRDIDESAMVDGATYWQVYWLLIFPLVRPILIVVGILTFVGTFNEFVLARVLLQNADNWTLMVGLYSFIGDNFAQNWGVFAAGALIGALPTLTIYLLLQDQIVGGLTQGAVKG